MIRTPHRLLERLDTLAAVDQHTARRAVASSRRLGHALRPARLSGDALEFATVVPAFFAPVDLIRFGGHPPKGGYDVRNGSHNEPASAPAIHG